MEVDGGDANSVTAVEGERVIEAVTVGGIEQHALGIFPAWFYGFVGEVGMELVEIAGTKPEGVVAGDQRFVVVFAIEDELAVRPCDCDVGDHAGQEGCGSVGEIGGLPLDGHGGNLRASEVAGGEVPDEVFEEPMHHGFVAQDVAETAFALVLFRQEALMDQATEAEQESIVAGVPVKLDAVKRRIGNGYRCHLWQEGACQSQCVPVLCRECIVLQKPVSGSAQDPVDRGIVAQFVELALHPSGTVRHAPITVGDMDTSPEARCDFGVGQILALVAGPGDSMDAIGQHFGE